MRGRRTSGGSTREMPIRDLDANVRNWAVKARVADKRPVRDFKSGGGKYMKITICDQSGEIEATFFNNAATTFDPIVQENGVYKFSRGLVKLANPQFNKTTHRYEITFDEWASIEPVDDDPHLPTQQYEFKPIDQLEQLAENANIDVIGVIHSYDQAMQIKTRSDPPRDVNKRDLTVVDQSGVEVKVTLWAENATQNDSVFDGNPVIALKGARISRFNDSTSLSANKMEIHPQCTEANALYQWYHQSGGAAQPIIRLSAQRGMGGGSWPLIKTIEEHRLACQTMGMGENEKTVSTIAAHLFEIDKRERGNIYYTADPKDHCKVEPDPSGGGGFVRNKDGQHIPECTYRYILKSEIRDHTGSLAVSAFDEVARVFMGGVEAADIAAQLDQLSEEDAQGYIAAVKEEHDDKKLYWFKIQSKHETWNDQMQLKHVVLRAEAIMGEASQEGTVAEGNNLLNLVEENLNDMEIQNAIAYQYPQQQQQQQQ